MDSYARVWNALIPAITGVDESIRVTVHTLPAHGPAGAYLLPGGRRDRQPVVGPRYIPPGLAR
jgi:hypothetical protein